MSILDIFKRIFKTEEISKPEEKLAVSLDNLSENLDIKQKSLEESKNNIKNLILREIEQFKSEITNQISLVKSLNIDKKKEQEKIKLIVKENLKLYLEQLNKFISSLNNTKTLDNQLLVKKIPEILSNFNKSSRNAFEKATILIGEELGRIKEMLSNLSRNIAKILADNRQIFENSEKINDIKNHLSELAKIKGSKKTIETSLENSKAYLQEKFSKKEKLDKEILDLKESQDYKKIIEEKENSRKSLESQLIAIKGKIDFKALAKIYHSIEDKNQIIQEYNQDFKKALEQDKNMEIIELAKSIDIDISELSAVKNQIKAIEQEKPAEIQLIIQDSEDRAKILENEIEKNKIETEEKNKQAAKIQEKTSLLEKEIKEKAKILNLNVN